jgi:uncharacterized protein YggE
MKRSLILITLLAATLLLTACAAPAAAPAADAPLTRQLTVTGNGKVNIVPDIASINIGVHTQEATVGEALAANTSQSQAVSDALQAAGIKLEDIQTTAFNVYPYQNYGPMGEMLDLAYVVDNSVIVTVRDLSQLGKILETVVQSGANNINGITFDVSDRTAAMSEARLAAVADARKQAEELAGAAGAKLDDVMYINVSSYSQPYGSYSLKGDAAMAASSVPVSAGQIQVVVDVTITYGLK